MNDFVNDLSGPKADPIEVTLYTQTQILRGFVYLPQSGKGERRLTNLLNSDKKFIAMTDVVATDRQTGREDAEKYSFVHVNMTAIELIKPSRS